MSRGGFVIPEVLIDNIEMVVTRPSPFHLTHGREYPKVTRRLRFRMWCAEVRWAIHDRLFPSCRANEDDD